MASSAAPNIPPVAHPTPPHPAVAPDHRARSQALLPALGAMTGLQGLIALALFAPGVLAPRLGLSEQAISAHAIAAFLIGALTASPGGRAAARLGSFAVAALCLVAVGLGTGLVAVAAGTGSLEGAGGLAVLLLAGALTGLAFGPETPASSALLGRLARPEQRPLVFSVRQCGSQFGAALGAVGLPALALLASPAVALGVAAAAAFAAVPVMLRLRRRHDAPASAAATPRISARELLREAPALRRLALAIMPWAALQLAINAYFVTFAVERLGLTHVAAGGVVALIQLGGLAGRLGWGALAVRVGAAPVVAGLGLGMAVATISLALAGPGLPSPLLAALAVVLGLTAGGWNGVLLAEVARLAPTGRMAEATGVVLTAAYTGLVLGPAFVAVVALASGLATAYAALGVIAGAVTIPLVLAVRRVRLPAPVN